MLGEDEEIGIKGLPSGNLSAGVGHIIIPKGVDIDLYKEDVYRSGRVSMNGGYGYGDFHNILVDREVIQRIKFPERPGQQGSPVVWVNIPKHNEPVIVGCLKFEDEYHSISEQRVRFTRGVNGNVVDLDLDGKKGKITISVNALEVDKNGEIEIILNSRNNDSKFKLKVNGEILINATGRIVQISDKTIETAVCKTDGTVTARVVMNGSSDETIDRLLYEDQFNNKVIINKEFIQVKADDSSVIKFGEGKEPLVKGSTLKGHLDSIIDALGKLTVPTAFGPSGTPINIAEFEAVRGKFDDFLSKLTNTD
jgi:hypothetical protein